MPLTDDGVDVIVLVSDEKSEVELQTNLILDVVPPLALTCAFMVVVVSPRLLAALIITTGGPIGVKERIVPKLVPTEFVAFALK